MVRISTPPNINKYGSPHPRGDGPQAEVEYALAQEFSPPAWGWSASRNADIAPRTVLPTRVGMVRLALPVSAHAARSPHPRGDGPRILPIEFRANSFSPPAWGWSEAPPTSDLFTQVLPTRVGMVRAAAVLGPRSPGSPHPRGDGPLSRGIAVGRRKFSPPAWGWSGLGTTARTTTVVLPTRVGMVRTGRWSRLVSSGSPHPRGDGPRGICGRWTQARFSPPAWGWSAVSVRDRKLSLVLPTRVGMVRARLAPANNLRVLPTRVGMVQPKGFRCGSFG